MNNVNIKIKVNSINNDLLGMPELFFSFLLKRFQKNKYVYKKNIFFTNSSLFFDLQFFLIFFLNLNSFKFFSKNCFVFITDSDLFYSNFNIFSINFLFKLKYFLKIKHQFFFLNNNDYTFFNCLSLWGLPCFAVSI